MTQHSPRTREQSSSREIFLEADETRLILYLYKKKWAEEYYDSIDGFCIGVKESKIELVKKELLKKFSEGRMKVTFVELSENARIFL